MQAELSWLSNPQVFQVNRCDAHSDHKFYETREDMEAGCEKLKQSLNGTWKFSYAEKPSDRQKDFLKKMCYVKILMIFLCRDIYSFRDMTGVNTLIPCIHGMEKNF